MNWVYRMIQINKRVVWLLPILFLILFIPITILLLVAAGLIVRLFTNITNPDVLGIITALLWFFLFMLFWMIIPALLIHYLWSRAESNYLGNNWHNYKNMVGKDLYHLLECYSGDDFIKGIREMYSNFNKSVLRMKQVSNIVDECLKETGVRYTKDSLNFLKRYVYFIFPVFPFIGRTLFTKISFKELFTYRGRTGNGTIFHTPDDKLYIVVGVEGVGGSGIPLISQL